MGARHGDPPRELITGGCGGLQRGIVGKVLPQPEAETTLVARCDYVIGKRSVTLASEDEFQPPSPTLGLFHRADSSLQL